MGARKHAPFLVPHSQTQQSSDEVTGDSGIFGAIFRFVLVMRTDLISDITWNSVQTMTWTTAEPSLYLIAACLPALRPLLKDFLHVTSFKDLRSRLRGSRGIKGSAGSYPSSSGETPRRPKPLDDEYGGCIFLLYRDS